MKKITSIILSLVIAVSLIACAADNSISETKPEIPILETVDDEIKVQKETEADSKEVHITGMANPMVEAEEGDFERKLGIHINSSLIAEDAENFIISGELAEVQWHQDNVNGDDVKLSFRAKKDAEPDDIHGVQGDKTEPTVTLVPVSENKELELSYYETVSGDYHIYAWKDGKIAYTLTFDNPMSQMALAEILDRIMDATGIRYHNSNVSALPVTDDLKDCIVNVSFDKDAIVEKDGVYSVKCDIFNEEYFDAVEISLLQIGDTIKINGDMVYVIDELETKENGEIAINGDTENGGFLLTPAGGGTYKVRELDDMSSYAFRGTVEFEMADDVILIDTADIENKCERKEVTGAEEAVKHLQDNDYLYPQFNSTSVRLEDGKIVEIKIVYVP